MESKLNYSAIETYAEEYSSKLCDSLFSESKSVTGDDILQFPVKQVGLFVLNNIYQSWALEAERLKSSYFNYQDAGVQASLQKLMNILSKNIQVDRESLQPIVNLAVYDTLLLLTSPYSYYRILLEKELTSLEILEATKKFTTLNKGIINKIIEKISESEELINDQERLLNEVFSEIDDDPQNISKELEEFKALHQLNENDFYLEVKEQVIIEPLEFNDEDDEEPSSENTLNDAYVDTASETVADTLNNNQLTTLKSMLSINEKFMFINDLFNGSQDDFNKVMDFLESCDDKATANSFIHNNYLKNNVWKANAPQVKDFLALLEKKYTKEL